MDGGAHIVNEAGQRQLPGSHAATEAGLRLEHENPAAGLGKDDCRREAVGPGANDDRIRLIHPRTGAARTQRTTLAAKVVGRTRVPAITVVSGFSRTFVLSEEAERKFCGI